MEVVPLQQQHEKTLLAGNMNKLQKALASLIDKKGRLSFLIPYYTDTLIPKKWMHCLRNYHSPSVGKENSFHGLNKAGFLANESFFKGIVADWDKTKKQADSHYEALEKARQLRIEDFKNKIKELEDFEV